MKLSRTPRSSILSLCLLWTAFLLSGGVHAAQSEEEAIRLAQTSRYNLLTGNWDVELERPVSSLVAEFKRILPQLDYHLVDEERDGEQRAVLIFRGEGDQRVAVKLKAVGGRVNLRLRVGLTGSEAKSSQLFTYVYQRME